MQKVFLGFKTIQKYDRHYFFSHEGCLFSFAFRGQRGVTNKLFSSLKKLKLKLNREHYFRLIILYNVRRQLFVLSDEAPHQSTIFRWYLPKENSNVDGCFSDDSRFSKNGTHLEKRRCLRKLPKKDNVTYRKLRVSLVILKLSIQKILHKELCVQKLVSRWIPHLLTKELVSKKNSRPFQHKKI